MFTAYDQAPLLNEISDLSSQCDYTVVYLHWGIYAYRKSALERFVALPPGILENCEKLEQLRALENGIRIRVVLSNLSSIGVDTPEDLAAAERRLMEESK